jgi:hypothetical protein
MIETTSYFEPGRGNQRRRLHELRPWVFPEDQKMYRKHGIDRSLLHLGSRQLFWECSRMEACEVFPTRIPIPLRGVFKVKPLDLCYLKYDLHLLRRSLHKATTLIEDHYLGAHQERV